MSDLSGACTGACASPPQLRVYQTIIFATPVLFAFVLLIMFCLLYFRRYAWAHNSIRPHIRAQLFAEGNLAVAPMEQGLSRSFRQRLPIALFDDSFSSSCQDSQCAVCLGDYQPYEKLQQLPACNHAFHLQCIDEWLAKNATCPICRTLLNEATLTNMVCRTESSNASSTDLLLRDGDESKFWEERVAGEAQDQDLPMKVDRLEGESSRCITGHEQGMRSMGGQTIRIELT